MPGQDNKARLSGAGLYFLRRGVLDIAPELLVISLFINLLALAAPLFVMQVYDRVIFHAGLSTLEALAAGMTLIIAFDFLLRQARSRILQRVAMKVDVEIGGELFGAIAQLPLQQLESRSAHALQFHFKDLETVRNALSGASLLALVDLPFVVLFLGLVVLVAPPLGWVMLGVCGAFLVLAMWNAYAVSRSTHAERQAAMQRDRFLSEMVQGRSVVKALALDRFLEPKWQKSHAETIASSITRGRRSDLAVNLGAAFGVIATVALTSIGALAILGQAMTVGALVAANLLAARLVAPLTQLVANWRTYAGFRDAASRLLEVMRQPKDRAKTTIEMPRPSGRIQLENVKFGYQAQLAPVLNDVTIRFGPGGVHAIVGPNGSGKTTLLKVLQGLYKPGSGRVLVDDGDISQFSRAQLAQWIGYAPQDCHLLAGSIRDNIARFHPDARDSDILEVAEASGTHAFAIDLPDGYDMFVGEGGARLSSGQRQRIAIARAMFGDPPILLLDEPTGNLDGQAEGALIVRLQKLAQDHTIVVVTHSPRLLSICDSITVLNRGQISLAGKADQVLPKLMSAAAR
ncbi:MAG TPA: ATP-binding cassette domain-containing protein [Dongiaceae bacterium]|nr:ATP-binding cassette domain-containing protein [Dongiaceae bacterium]